MALSPWWEAGSSPVTSMPSGDKAPMHRKKAALEKSPSTRSSSGMRLLWEPGME